MTKDILNSAQLKYRSLRLFGFALTARTVLPPTCHLIDIELGTPYMDGVWWWDRVEGNLQAEVLVDWLVSNDETRLGSKHLIIVSHNASSSSQVKSFVEDSLLKVV